MLDASSLIPPSSIDPIGPMAAFFWGAGGSLALEIVALYGKMKAETADGVPLYYKSLWFWGVRLILAGIAGALAMAEGATKALIAVNIGASAPAILQLLSGTREGPDRLKIG